MKNTSGFAEADHRVDVCVVGGGMAGLCAAIAAARSGAKTLLVQDRPVLGGNASSEVRMWICGAHGKQNKETGILEEVQLDNCHLNPAGNYSIWDAVLWNKVVSQPNLTVLLNTSICGGESEGVAGDDSLRRLTHLRGWTLTSQTWHTIESKVFIDCSGDSVLAPLSGAQTRWGRESRSEFDEDIQPAEADRKTMGNSLLIQLRRVDEEVPFVAPPFAYRFDSHEQFQHRLTSGVQAHNFWWIELGGLQDTIRDAEAIRDELMRTVWGVWDFIKNRSPYRKDAANWALEWVGALPGKRENRRYIGPHTLTQNEVRAGGEDHLLFKDTVAYGGWSMDDHHPAGFMYPGRPTIFHPAPSPYPIPYRCLVSRNVVNLMMAGRNISVTHAALSSTRVMATCSLLGQAAGTAAALAIERWVAPAQLFPNHIGELQRRLQAADVWLPGLARVPNALSCGALTEEPALLCGHDRPVGGNTNCWEGHVGDAATLSWSASQNIPAVRVVFDSNLANDKRMPCSYPLSHTRHSMPASLARRFRVEVRHEGRWTTAYAGHNIHRLRHVPIHQKGDAVRIVIEQTWGDGTPRLFGFEATTELPTHLPAERERIAWDEVVARVDRADLAPPEHNPVHEGPFNQPPRPRRAGA